MDFEDFLKEIPEPPKLPMPSWWPMVFALLGIVVGQVLYGGQYRLEVYLAGVISTTAGVVAFFHLHARREVRFRQAELDAMFEGAKLRVRMMTKLVERHGGQETLQIMTFAEQLVDDGDFDDIRVAVASIERHHDMEPTSFD